MRLSTILWISVILMFGIGSGPTPLAARTFEGRDLLLYGGKYTDTNLGQILFRGKTDFRESFLAVGALNYQIGYSLREFHFESEGQLGVHFGEMNHLELNGLFIVRRPASPVFPALSLAMGEGLSLATENPELENPHDNLNRRREKSSSLLNYLMFEMDYALPAYRYDPRLFFRIHHRSGAFGTYCPPTCGSNFITYGVKFSLD